MHTKSFVVRGYARNDRAVVRQICCDTGFLGQPIDPVFEDRDVFADFFTDYYLRCEPDAAFVVTIDDSVVGFLLGCRYPFRHQLFSAAQSLLLAAKVLLRYRRYKPETRHYLWWILRNAPREVPPSPRRIGHFHVNFLPQVISIAAFREILETFLRFLANQKVTKISAQMVTFDDRRGFALLERYGFRVLNRSEITKFKEFTDQTVYLSTILRDLDPADERLVRPIWER
ncbi:MAG TPA: hypothetical protein VHS80_15955 [Chthoniobacterales bacterium]|nr:hypothetical protein [Chthoniobacterales bacterium]